LIVACDNREGIPQPDPIPHISLLRWTGLPDPTGTVDVVGLPGCVAGAGEVTLEQGTSHATTTSTATGTFYVGGFAIKAYTDIQVRYQASASVVFQVTSVGVGGAIPPGPISGVPPVSGTSGGRLVMVRGKSTAAALTPVLVINVGTGEVASGASGQDQTFQIEIAASSGDVLRIYDDDAATLGSAWQVVVP